MVKHAASIVCQPLTATALLYKLWDVFAALSLPLARKLAAKFATVIRWRANSPPGSRLASCFALHWILIAATVLSPKAKPPRTAPVYEGPPVKAIVLSASLPQITALALAAQKERRFASKASARRVKTSRKLLPNANLSTLAAQRRPS